MLGVRRVWAVGALPSRVLAAILVAMAGLCACVAPVDEIVGLRLHLPTARGCRPASLDGLRIVALGDFAARDDRVVEVRPSDAIEIERFPTSTAAVAALARGGGWEGFAVVPFDDGSRVTGADGLLLPLETPCPSPDPEARAPRGAAVAELDDGSLVIVGGLDDLGRATRRVVRLPRGLEVTVVEPRVPVNAVAFASATSLGASSVLIAGGASGDDGELRDTFEILGLDDDGPVRRVGTLSAGVRDHAAVRRGTEVILVGGADASGPIDRLERIDPERVVAAPIAARLVRARRSPIVVSRLDGTLVVAGGYDEAGPVATIEVVRADLARSEEVPLSLPPPLWVALLPGPRLLWAAAGETFVVLLDATPEVVRLDIVAPTPIDAVAAGLSDGRALVVGRVGTLLSATLVDPSAESARARTPSRAPGVLHAFADGVVVELDAVGATSRRESRLSPLDPPRASWQLPADASELGLDAGPRWALPGPGERGLIARVDGARLDVPVLRVARARIAVDLEGEGEIVLTSDEGVWVSVTIDATEVSVGGCSVPRPTGVVTIVRDGSTLDLGGVACSVGALPPRVGVGVRANAGTRVRSIALERLE